MQVLREGFNENAKRIDDDGSIAKTKTDCSDYYNPPAVEKLRMLHAGRLTEMRMRIFVRRIKLVRSVQGR